MLKIVFENGRHLWLLVINGGLQLCFKDGSEVIVLNGNYRLYNLIMPSKSFFILCSHGND